MKMIQAIKELHPEEMILIKKGAFYDVYGKDAIVLSYLFGYKIIEKEMENCGFPLGSIHKVKAILEQGKISYKIVSASNQYEVETEEDYKEKNKYPEVYEKARKERNIRKRMEQITEYLIREIEEAEGKAKIRQMEEMVYETRKVQNS